ncbi:23S rRNA pseudouridine(2604) synthase RluF [Exiguobacterium sp. Helios]|jgi:23S rRNA pseudouridine2604 synthase|uniref:23S rRNA pseudouridine(2604) synthase RluF n=1 Tax=unclassified Exiguobacterium TaxID=2644629 RepID=UPI00165E85E7|nr:MULTISPECIES: 23S rRNA pseudouridine(2604) synthase RluF [unclassified Exiguobacterium]QNR20409.1 23S rRNA pseudouridine(2604) synthase RluF [Exiguobacterium sp. Helios]
MRINKFISETGFCSRRAADKLIDAGRVTINGNVAELGSQVEKTDAVEIDGHPLQAKPELEYLILNKPVGITCTTERDIEGNIIDFVNHPKRIFPIGRLDKDSDGLIILTNDGDIVNRILRAENNHDKEYIVTVDAPITETFIEGMASGVEILGTTTKECVVEQLESRTFRIVLTQGLNRQIRRMCKEFGYRVKRLQRVRIMNVELGDLPIGEWRDLTESEMKTLFQILDQQ